MCANFTNWNNACLKDYYPLPCLGRLVDGSAGHEVFDFLDASRGYHQILLHDDEQEKTAFITEYGLYCWRVMPFGLKNAGATYQRMVNRVFKEEIGSNMEIYVDDMIVKSRRRDDHLGNLRETLEVLKSSCLRINPEKCSFGVTSGKFLSFIIGKRGIKPNPDKIEAILNMKPPTSYKEVQRLTGCLIALSRFISKEPSQASKEPFLWDEECERAFAKLKEYLGSPKLLTRLEGVEELQLYLAVSEGAVSSVLVREEEGLIYYVSHVLHGAEESYPLIDKFVFTVVITARKLKAYFEAHPIKVMTNQPIKRIMSNPSMTGRLTTWAVELSEFEVSYAPRTSVKARLECTARVPEEVQGPREGKLKEVPWWKTGNYTWMERATKKATNNKAEYEAKVTGLQIAQALKIRWLLIRGASKLAIEQIRGDCGVKSEVLAKYHSKALILTKVFEYLLLEHIPRSQNEHADHLSRLATTYFGDLPSDVHVEVREHLIHMECNILPVLEKVPNWRSPIARYLVKE
ncbi:hypothetical protein LIER_02462 [Lithospermum erythrorhizon]|uniref:Uncharacterized protein n=1 Tax=Lithospermum erythrorhizon TaxID=34254 RepID=A0AAV3NPL1_LITER